MEDLFGSDEGGQDQECMMFCRYMQERRKGGGWSSRGRPRRRFMGVVKEDMRMVGVREEQAESGLVYGRGFAMAPPTGCSLKTKMKKN